MDDTRTRNQNSARKHTRRAGGEGGASRARSTEGRRDGSRTRTPRTGTPRRRAPRTGTPRSRTPRTGTPHRVGPLRWLRRKLSDIARWVRTRLSGSLRSVGRLLLLRWAGEHLPAPLRWLARAFIPGEERGFGFWWLVGTLAVAVGIGMLVALLLTPVAGLVALLGVAVWALVRRHRSKRDAPDDSITRSDRRNSVQTHDQDLTAGVTPPL